MTPTPAAPTPVSDDPLERCIESLRADKGLLASLLGRAKARWQGSDKLQLSFPALKGIQKKLLEKPGTVTLIEQKLQGETGSRIQVEILIGGAAVGNAATEAAPDADAPAADTEPEAAAGQDLELPELGKQAQDLFRARLFDKEGEAPA